MAGLSEGVLTAVWLSSVELGHEGKVMNTVQGGTRRVEGVREKLHEEIAVSFRITSWQEFVLEKT